MLAAIDQGYDIPEVSSKLDLQMNNGSLQVTEYHGDAPSGAAYAENLANIFYDAAPVKEFRRKYNMTRVGGKEPFLEALLEAWKQFSAARALKNGHSNGHSKGNGNGKRALPKSAFVEFKQTTGQSELWLFRDYFRSKGFQAEIFSPEQLEYRNGKLSVGAFEIDLVYRRFTIQEFLTRFDLSHPLVEAYRDHKVCVVNSFRSEMAHKKSMLALLTDETLTKKFPLAERKAIKEHVPWTRLLKPGKTFFGETPVELLDYVRDHRETLALKPDDDGSDLPVYFGREMSQVDWETAMRQAQRSPYVVQESAEPARLVFPLLSYGHLEFREMNVDVHPQAFLGKVSGCSSWLSAASNGVFSASSGIAPTFIIDAKVER